MIPAPKVLLPDAPRARKDRPRQPWIVRWTVGTDRPERSFPTIEDLVLPPSPGIWGSARVWHSDQRAGAAYRDALAGDTGDTKTGTRRTVPLHPALVIVRRQAVKRRKAQQFTGWGPFEPVENPDSGRTGTALWLTRTGRRPSASNWHRCWARVRGTGTTRIYDLRHVHATAAIRAGMALGEIARRLVHTVETLTRDYAGVFEADEAAGNELLGPVFDFGGWQR